MNERIARRCNHGRITHLYCADCCVVQLLKDVNSLREERDVALNNSNVCFDDLQLVIKDNAKLIEGLRWYANADNYACNFYTGDIDAPDSLDTSIELDDGERARTILSDLGINL